MAAKGGVWPAVWGCNKRERRARTLENLSSPNSPKECTTPPFYNGRQERKLACIKTHGLAMVAKWKKSLPKWLHGEMGGHEWPRER